ncbi:MAG TPA: fused MFS/spermidine synthase [Turneriella sp.]|nr:fused MFS/spermidine synthase [Turneriella sp.]
MKIETNNGYVRLIEGGREQSLWRKSTPDLIQHTYLRTMALATLTTPLYGTRTLSRALMLGLGGGILCRFFEKHFPYVKLDVAEPDTNIIRIAHEHFMLNRSVAIHAVDGRRFLKSVQHRYDIIILDAFDAIYIPHDLMGVEFLRLVKNRLTPSGIFVANTWMSKNLMRHEEATYRYVFSPLFDLRRSPNTDGNRILLFNANGEAKNLQTTIHKRAADADTRVQYENFYQKRFSLQSAAEKLRIQTVDAPSGEILIDDINADMLRRAAEFN